MYDYIITKFFKGYLNFRTNDEIENKVELKVNNNKHLLVKLRDFYRMMSDEYDDKDRGSEEEEEKTPLQIMIEKQRGMDQDKPMELNI